MPDLNSLPPSRSSSGSPLHARVSTTNPEPLHGTPASPSPRSSSLSLAASATINAGIQNEDSRRSSSSSNRNRPSVVARSSERRRSNVAMNLNLNDPSLPGPGELQTGDHRASVAGHHFRTASPNSPSRMVHHRTPSLGELHQELEQEQEAQVNRLLEMIRQQQAQLQQIQRQNNSNQSGEGVDAIDDSTPTSERSFSFPTVPSNLPLSVTNPRPRSPATLPISLSNPRPRSPTPRGSFDLSRQSSRRSRPASHVGSPALRPVSAGLQAHGDEWLLSGSNQGVRDESAFYQAETQMLTRENQMLRMRIRELERQVSEANSAVANSPVIPSNLTAPPIEADASSGVSAVQSATENDNKE